MKIMYTMGGIFSLFVSLAVWAVIWLTYREFGWICVIAEVITALLVIVLIQLLRWGKSDFHQEDVEVRWGYEKARGGDTHCLDVSLVSFTESAEYRLVFYRKYWPRRCWVIAYLIDDNGHISKVVLCCSADDILPEFILKASAIKLANILEARVTKLSDVKYAWLSEKEFDSISCPGRRDQCYFQSSEMNVQRNITFADKSVRLEILEDGNVGVKQNIMQDEKLSETILEIASLNGLTRVGYHGHSLSHGYGIVFRDSARTLQVLEHAGRKVKRDTSTVISYEYEPTEVKI